MTQSNSLNDMQMAFAAHLRDPANQPAPEGIENRRMQIYRDLFYNNVEGFVSGAFPVLRSLTSDEKWHRMVRDFFAHYRCQTPYFLEISEEFLQYLQNQRTPEQDDWPFILELAHYEWVELVADSAVETIPTTGFNPDGNLLNGRPCLSPLAYVVSYQFPVHQIGPDYTPQEPSATPTFLIVYRNSDLEVKFMEINSVSARLLVLLQENESFTGLNAIEVIQGEINHPNPQVVIDGGQQALNHLHQTGIILGTQLKPIA